MPPPALPTSFGDACRRRFGRAAAASLFALAAVLAGGGHPAIGQPANPLRVTVEVTPRSPYVGQAVDLTISVIGKAEAPIVATPLLEKAEVRPGPTDRSAAPGRDGSSGLQRFRTRFQVIPRRSGSLTIPPIEVRLGDRVGWTGPTKRRWLSGSDATSGRTIRRSSITRRVSWRCACRSLAASPASEHLPPKPSKSCGRR